MVSLTGNVLVAINGNPIISRISGREMGYRLTASSANFSVTGSIIVDQWPKIQIDTARGGEPATQIKIVIN